MTKRSSKSGRRWSWTQTSFRRTYSLGNAYIQKSMYKEGIAEFEKALAISPGNNAALSGLGYAYAVAGRRAEAQKVLDQLNELVKAKVCSSVVPGQNLCGPRRKGQGIRMVGEGLRGALFDWRRFEREPSLRSAAVGPALRRPAAAHEPAALTAPERLRDTR